MAMSKKGRTWGALLSASLLSGATFAACGDNGNSMFNGKDGGGGSSDVSLSPDVPKIKLGEAGGDALLGTLAISPTPVTLHVTNLAALPSQTFTAKYTSIGGSPKTVTPIW